MPSQDSEMLCIYVLGVSSQDSEMSYICVLGYQVRTVICHVFVC